MRSGVFPQHWVFYFYVSASECPSVLAILAIFFVKCPIWNLFLLKPKPNIMNRAINWGGQAGKVPLASGPGIPWRQFSVVIDGPQYGWRSHNDSCFSVWESRGWSRIINLGKYIENSSCDVCLWFLDSLPNISGWVSSLIPGNPVKAWFLIFGGSDTPTRAPL